MIQLTVLILAITPALAGKSKIAKDLEKADQEKVVDVIVRFDKSLSKVNMEKLRAKFVNKAEAVGGLKKADLDLINGSVVQVKAKHLQKLADGTGSRVPVAGPDTGAHARHRGAQRWGRLGLQFRMGRQRQRHRGGGD